MLQKEEEFLRNVNWQKWKVLVRRAMSCWNFQLARILLFLVTLPTITLTAKYQIPWVHTRDALKSEAGTTFAM